MIAESSALESYGRDMLSSIEQFRPLGTPKVAHHNAGEDSTGFENPVDLCEQPILQHS